MKDLAVLVADKNTEAALKSLLTRGPALGIQPIEFDIFVHPRRDPGCVNEAHLFLRPFANTHRYALVVLDHEGSGRDNIPPMRLAEQVTEQLSQNGWLQRGQAVVIAPELEVWVWSPSPHVPACIGWEGRQPDLRSWLESTGRWPNNQVKPARPKEALEAALREIRRPRSSAIYADLAASVSLRGHSEPAFLALTAALRSWFAAP